MGQITADDWFDDDDLFSYRGWEVLRLMGGIDLRSSPSLGVGFYGGVAFGRYDRVEDSTGDFDIDRERFRHRPPWRASGSRSSPNSKIAAFSSMLGVAVAHEAPG